MAYMTGKIETTGSIFRHETVGLLPSPATTLGKSISKYISVCRSSSPHSLRQIESRIQELKSQP